MKYAADFRRIAREALSGRWMMAVLAGLVASVLGAIASNSPNINFTYNENGADVQLEVIGQQIFSTQTGWEGGLVGILLGMAGILLVVGLVMAVAYFILGSVVGVGYCNYNLDLVDRRKEAEIGTLFAHFKSWKTIAKTKLLQCLYVFLWSLLFVIPGIIASFSYAMTGYILAENPELTPSEAIERSKRMMSGNRWRLFCLQLSFIGWDILCGLTLGIGHLWLTPYRQAASAAFYREISGTEYVAPAPEAEAASEVEAAPEEATETPAEE